MHSQASVVMGKEEFPCDPGGGMGLDGVWPTHKSLNVAGLERAKEKSHPARTQLVSLFSGLLFWLTHPAQLIFPQLPRYLAPM